MKFSPVGSCSDWYRLLRIGRPVGYWLLLWPTLWGLLAASPHGLPSLKNTVVFVCGVLLMRSAGCVVNDIADRDFDGHVERTRDRPIAAGRIASGAALIGFVLMLSLALLLVAQTSVFVVELALVGALLAACYPFLKRYTHFPQAWLGMAFGWGAVMAWAAEQGDVSSPVPWLLFAANICWSLSYDTAYALVDRDDDLKIGVKSTAIWLGEHAVAAIILLGLLCVVLLGLVAFNTDGFWIGLGWWVAMILQLLLCGRLMRCGERWGFTFFMQSHYVGALFAAGFVLQGLSAL